MQKRRLYYLMSVYSWKINIMKNRNLPKWSMEQTFWEFFLFKVHPVILALLAIIAVMWRGEGKWLSKIEK